MDKPSRTTRKRVAISPSKSDEDFNTKDSDDEEFEFTPKKKNRKITKTVTKISEKVTKKRPVKVEGIATAKRKSSSSTKAKSKLDNEISEVDGQVQTKTKAKTSKVTEKLDEHCFENSDDVLHNMWNESEMLSHVEKVPLGLARNFIALLTEGCTLPFIARYRKANVYHLMPDRLQELFESYQAVAQLKKKVMSVIETLKKNKKLTPQVEKSLLNARNLSEVDLVYAPLKSHSLSLAERARSLGLEPIAIKALEGQYINIHTLCTNEEELATPEKVETHIMHIVADVMYKDTRVLEYMRGLKEETRFTITSSRTKSSAKEKKETQNKQDKKSDPETYKIYFEWKCPSHFVKPHQTLALNRGEDEKVLSVKVVVPDWFHHKLERFCLTLWRSNHWVRKGLDDAYNRLIKPWLSRQVRSDLTNTAQKEAVKTFTTNLEKYLLTEPIKNRIIAGLDPGFKAGCKLGVINANGDKLEACTLFPDLRGYRQNDVAAKQLKDFISKLKVELIGLGNGTACRETEAWLRSHQISDQIPVIIVPEQGASIYSISKEAQKVLMDPFCQTTQNEDNVFSVLSSELNQHVKFQLCRISGGGFNSASVAAYQEHPNMDPNLISALSIARRVLDPLGELIKVEPKNLGVGMYQHDIPPKMLETALDCAVEKVVSLVGVDINTASQAMLRRISGLNEGRAKKIIAYRQEKGSFTTREEILKVAGIGKVTYQQCAGFLKVLGGTEPLDATIIHPESYSIAKAFAKKIGVNIKNLSKADFPAAVERLTSSLDVRQTSEDLDTDACTLELIVNAFKQKAHEDNVITFCRPVYSLAVQATDQIREGMSLTGVVRNVVPFGCFVDCGVGDNGLIHRSKLCGNQTPKLGDRVAVTVVGSPQPRKLQLRLDRILD